LSGRRRNAQTVNSSAKGGAGSSEKIIGRKLLFPFLAICRFATLLLCAAKAQAKVTVVLGKRWSTSLKELLQNQRGVVILIPRRVDQSDRA